MEKTDGVAECVCYNLLASEQKRHLALKQGGCQPGKGLAVCSKEEHSQASMSAELLAEHPLTYEEERGKPMPTRNHGAIQANLVLELSKHREFRVTSEVTYELIPGKRLTPDLSVETRKPLDLLQDTHPITPPLLAVEIVSPSQGLDEIIDKVKFYLANGVKSVWVVVPPLLAVTIFLPGGTQQSYHSGVVRDPAIGVTADLDAVFS